jgi:hypothetical protein
MKRRCRMEEKIKKDVQFALGRREFLKMGLAAGLAAGIPMGIIPKIGSRRAYAEITEALEKIPAETRWTITGNALTGMSVGIMKALFDAVGQEKYNEIIKQLMTAGGGASKQIADNLSLAAGDAKSTAETFRTVLLVSMGPEFRFQVLEATAEKAAYRCTECPWWNRVKELGTPYDLLSVGSSAYTNSFLKSLNPKVTVSQTGAMCRGDAYCEYVFEL